MTDQWAALRVWMRAQNPRWTLAALSQHLEVHPNTLRIWARDNRVPRAYADSIDMLTGGVIRAEGWK